jgi:hypothetical protein
VTVAGDVSAGERRTNRERREHGGGDAGRRGTPDAISPLVYIIRSLALICLLMLVIVFALRNTRPVFATRGTLAEELRRHAPTAAEVLASADSTPIERFMSTEKFREEKRNFFEDVMRTRQVDSARADSIAQFAVREAYTRGISPALIFGVMLTENARFISKAMSNVGAVGLMQVYPKVWLRKEFTDSLGHDLASDSTNVRFGVFILSRYFNPRTKTGETRTRDYRTALLRYNGCVKGTNTPHCKNYPDKVKQYVEASAKSICDGRGFYECIAKPFMTGLLGDEAKAAP